MKYTSYVNVRRAAGASMPMRPRATPAVHASLLSVGVPAAVSSVCACRQASAPFRLVRSRILDQDRATGQPIRVETHGSYVASLLACSSPTELAPMAKHWSSRGSGLVADAAAAVPHSLGGCTVAAGEQDLSSFGQNLLHLLHPAVGAAQSWQVISLPVANATSPRHRKRTTTYSVTCCM